MRSRPALPQVNGKTIRRSRSTSPAATRLRTSETLPIVRIGTLLSRLTAGSASIASPATTRVFAHSSGSDSVDDTTTFGSAVSRWDTRSDPLVEMVASAS